MEWGWTWVGVLGLLATGGVALLVFLLQKKTHDDWAYSDQGWKAALDAGVSDLRGAVKEARSEVADLGELVRQLAEQKAAAEDVKQSETRLVRRSV